MHRTPARACRFRAWTARTAAASTARAGSSRSKRKALGSPVRDSVYVVEVGNDLDHVVDRRSLQLQRAGRLLDADEPDIRHYGRSFSAIDWSSFQAMPGLLSTSGRKSHGVIP